MTEPREPGWYQDPFGTSADDRRYWDGDTWLAVQPSQPAWQQEPEGFQSQPYAGQPYQAQPERGWQQMPLDDERHATPDGVALASWRRRLVAYVVDGILLALVTIASAQLLGVGPAISALAEDSLAADSDQAVQDAFQAFLVEFSGPMLAVSLIAILASGAYHIVLTARRGRTIGKQLLGIRVRLRDEEALPGWGTAGLRWLVHFGAPNLLSGLPLIGFLATVFPIVDGLWPLWDQRRQAIHDMVAKTVVVVG